MKDFEAARTAMVDRQVRPSDVTRFAIIEAMLWAPRERFAPRAQRDVAYADAPLEFASGRAMLEPRTFAKLLSAADVRDTELVLDVGAGYGYGAAVMARMAAAVVALECDEAVAKSAQEIASELELHNVMVETGPLPEGAPKAGPFDVIFLEGAVAEAPQTLLSQLKPGGRLAAIVGAGRHGQARLFRRGPGGVSSAWIFDATAPVLPGFDAAEAFQF